MRRILPARSFRALPALLAGMLLLLLALVGCGAPTTAARPTPDANAILQQASKINFRDAAFTLTFTMTMQGQTVTGTGSGKVTMSPQRADLLMTFPLTVAGKTLQLTVEAVTDAATNAAYTKTSGLPGVPSKWTKTSLA